MFKSRVIKESGHNEFGGPWTIEKLGILEKYLDAYTTVLSKQEWCRLVYIDAFAGTGKIEISKDDHEKKEFIDGSAQRAIDINNKSFDRLLFVELDEDRCLKLKSLRELYPLRDIQIINDDANAFLQSFHLDKTWRGVLFLDPFATEVDWDTIEKVSHLEILDIWILFPTSAIARMLPTDKNPDSVLPAWANRLNRIYGGDDWRSLYAKKEYIQLDLGLFDDSDETTEEYYRQEGSEELVNIYKSRLEELFEDRFLKRSRSLKNPSNNAPLFEFMFCVGSKSPKAITAAHGIAKHIIDHL